MNRRAFLIGALVTSGVTAFGANPAFAAKRPVLKGEYSGTITIDGQPSSFSVDINKQNKKTGKVAGDANVFGQNIGIAGRISSGGNTVVFNGSLPGETVVFRGQLLNRGKRIVGTWTISANGKVVSQGTFELNRSVPE